VVLARRRTEKSGISGNGVRRNSGVDETAGWVEREKVLNGTRSSSERKKEKNIFMYRKQVQSRREGRW